MSNLDDLKNSVRKLPELSEKNYSLAGYIAAGLISLSGAFFVYEILFRGDLTFSAQWNMFKSPLIGPLWFVGLVVMFMNWSKFNFSYDTYEKTTYASGRVEVKRDYDIISWLMGHVVAPILGYFVLVPLFVAAVIYYPLMCIVHIVGSIFPYVLSLLVIGIIAAAWMLPPKADFRFRSYILVAVGLFFTAAFSWGGYAIHTSAPGSTIQMLADTQGASGNNDEFSTGNNDSNDEFGPAATEGDSSDEFGEGTTEGQENSDMDDEADDQFAGVGEEGLLGCLPEGTTTLEGDMDGFPIEITITKNDSSGDVSGVYKNVKYGTTMNLSGESLPAMGGDINFYGKADGQDWTFYLSGTCDHVTGTAQSGGKEFRLSLHKKN